MLQFFWDNPWIIIFAVLLGVFYMYGNRGKPTDRQKRDFFDDG